MGPTTKPRRTVLVCVLLSAVTFAAYWPVLRGGFIYYDDPEYVTGNLMVRHGLSWQGLVWAFTTFHASNWHPVTWLSHMLDCQLFGLNPMGHHLSNLLFHVANVALLFFLLLRLTGAFWRSTLVAALFGLHPLHGESVAWISERKDVLSGFFFILTLLAYARYAEVSKIRSPASKAGFRFSIFYSLALASFGMGLMSKPMLVTTPFVLLLLDYWPLRRLELSNLNFQPSTFRPLLLEKAPFFALSAVSCALTFLAQNRGGAVESLDHIPLDDRAANALVGYLVYLEKMICPTKLAVLYLRPDQWPVWLVASAIVVLAGITLLTLAVGHGAPLSRPRPRSGDRARSDSSPEDADDSDSRSLAPTSGWLLVGWLWFLGMLVPVIGLVQVGNQYIADRYTYLPLIGCFIILVWGGCELCNKLPCKLRSLLLAMCFLLLGASGFLTFRQAGYWKSTETLFEHCLAVTEDNYVAHNVLGAYFAVQRRFDDAKAQFLAALAIQPAHADTLRNLAVLLTEHGEFDQASDYLEQAVRIRPTMASYYGKLGFVLDTQGRIEQAAAYYREDLRLRPDDEEVLNNLAWILATNPNPKLRDGPEAVRLTEHACELTSYRKTLLVGTLAAAYAEAGRFAEAVTAAEQAVALAEATGQKDLAQRNRLLLELYRAQKPFHEPPPNKNGK